MSKWDDFKKELGKIADKTATKTRELTDTAALKIKIANKESDRDLEYKKLGKLTYAKLKNTDANAEELTEKISESLANLDRILAELEELKILEAEKKAEKEAEKAAKKAEKEAQNAPKEDEEEAQNAPKEDEEEDKLDVQIMNEFNNARKTADEAYEEAKQAAEDAK